MDKKVIIPSPCGGFLDSAVLEQLSREADMDPQTLPAQAQAIYQQIKKEYKVAFEPLQLGDVRLNLLRATDLEQILGGKDPLKNPSEFPFWVKLWESAIVLGQLLVDRPHPTGTTVLELGAGLGVPGLAAAATGCQVTLTDYEETILNFERVSAAASGLLTDNLRFAMLDWLNPPEMERYDVVVGAEVLFREEFFKPLLDVIKKSLKPEGVVYLAHDIGRKSVKPFLEMAQADYTISVSKRKLKNLERDKEILLTRLVPK